MARSLAFNIYASMLFPLPAATLIVYLRFYGRITKQIHLWWDDWLALSGLVWLLAKPQLQRDEMTNLLTDSMHHL